jgi:hypothetical protein
LPAPLLRSVGGCASHPWDACCALAALATFAPANVSIPSPATIPQDFYRLLRA